MSVCYVVVGGTGTGKTKFTTDEIIVKYPNVIVYDVQNQYEFLPDWKVGMKGKCRVTPQMMDYKKFCSLGRMLTNTLFVNEEATMFLTGTLDAKVANLLVCKRHTKNRYLYIFHGFKQIPPRLLSFTDYLIQFRTGVSDYEAVVGKTKSQAIIKCYERLEILPRFSKFIHKISSLSNEGVF